MDTYSYVITVTPDGSLLVNETPAAPADGSQYSSDALLAWALDQVRQQWEAAGQQAGSAAVLNVTIDDQRDGGYGRQKTRLRPGQAASIDALRSRTGKNLEHWTPPTPAPVQPNAPVQPDAATEPAPALDETDQPTSAATPPRDTPAGPVAAPDPAAASTPPSVAPTPLPDPPPVEDPPGLPEQSLHDQLTTAEPAQSTAPPKKRTGFLSRKESKPKERTKAKERSKPKEQNEDRPRKEDRSRSKERPQGQDGSAAATTGLLTRWMKPKAREEEPAGPSPDTPPHPGWTKYTPRVLRPRLPEAEKAKEKERQSSSKTIMTVVITFVLALIVFIAWNQIGGSNQYVAVCVDQRTSARVNTDEPCVKGQAAYFRWWWVPDGSSVPAVGGQVDPQQGSFVEPDPEAPRTYGFSADGGVYSSSG